MKYEEKIQISQQDFIKWNFLLSKDIDEMTDEEKEKYNAKPNDMIPGYEVKFNDGSNITVDICSGSQNYFDDIVWHSANGKIHHTFDCNFQIDVCEEFYITDDIYEIKLEIVE